MPKVVVDTSVFVAGLLTHNPASNPAQIISMWKSAAFTLVMSPQILQEVTAKLFELGVEESEIIELVKSIAQIALQIPGAYESTKLDNVDAGDNMFLAAAYESKADFLVSLDSDLLNIKHFYGTQILLPHLLVRNLIGHDISGPDQGEGQILEDELVYTCPHRQELRPGRAVKD